MSESPTTATIGFVGLGHMGGPMVRRLVEAGYRVQVFDVAPEARASAVTAGATDAEDLAAAARGADAVILMLPNSQVVASVLVYRFLSIVPVLAVAAVGGLLWDRPGAQQLAERELTDASSTASGEAAIVTRKNPG